MPRLSKALAEAYAIAPAYEAVIDTLEIKATGRTSIYLTNSISDIVATLETSSSVTFHALPFTVTLPKSSSDGLPVLAVTVDNINHLVSDYILEALKDRVLIAIKYRPYLASNLSVAQSATPMTFYAIGAAISAAKVVLQASFPDIVNKRFPNEMYSTKLFPGLNG